MHIFQMVLPDAFGQYGVKFFHNVFSYDVMKKIDSTLPKKHLAKPFEKYA